MSASVNELVRAIIRIAEDPATYTKRLEEEEAAQARIAEQNEALALREVKVAESEKEAAATAAAIEEASVRLGKERDDLERVREENEAARQAGLADLERLRDEYQADLAEQHAKLKEREAEIEAKGVALSDRHATLNQREAELDTLAKNLEHQSAKIEERGRAAAELEAKAQAIFAEAERTREQVESALSNLPRR